MVSLPGWIINPCRGGEERGGPVGIRTMSMLRFLVAGARISCRREFLPGSLAPAWIAGC
jgi:hypothetical protein